MKIANYIYIAICAISAVLGLIISIRSIIETRKNSLNDYNGKLNQNKENFNNGKN